MEIHSLIFMFVCFYCPQFYYVDGLKEVGKDYHTLRPQMEKLLVSEGQNRLEIFCYPGEAPDVLSLLKTVELALHVPDDNFHYYEGSNLSSIKSQYEEQSWLSFSPWRPQSLRLNPFNHSCVGIETAETFRVKLKVRYVDFWRIITLGSGVCLFIMAPLFAHNIMFHYLTGVSVGIFGSLLVIVFLLSRLVPKKSGALAVLFGGWGLLVYFFQYFWSNCMSLLKEYQVVAVGYIFVAGLISFAVVYRFGPISDKRSLKLVQWSLQLTGLCLIFFSSQCREFSLAVDIILIINYNIPSSWKSKVKTLWLRKFPPKRRLLSEEDYLEQSRVETKKALDELREFCHSPDCNAWKTMTRLKSPHRYAEKFNVSSEGKSVFRYQMQRFAEFVEGDFHLTDDEILSYESSSFRDRSRHTDEELLTSDEEEVENTSF